MKKVFIILLVFAMTIPASAIDKIVYVNQNSATASDEHLTRGIDAQYSASNV